MVFGLGGQGRLDTSDFNFAGSILDRRRGSQDPRFKGATERADARARDLANAARALGQRGERLNIGGANRQLQGTGLGLSARGQQQQLVGQLQQAAAGVGESAAAAQLRQGQDAALRSQLALAATGRGNPALAQRQAAQNIGQLQQQAAQQTSILRGQEQAQARTALANALGGIRQQDALLAQQGLSERELGVTAGQIGLRGLQASGTGQLALAQTLGQQLSDEEQRRLALAQARAGLDAQQGAAQRQFLGGAIQGFATGGASLI